MTQSVEKVDPPFFRRHVQLTCAAIASCVFAWNGGGLLRSVLERQRDVRWDVGSGGRDATGHGALIQIDLNQASPRELALLPGVGPVLAQRIAEHRNRNGRFGSTDELIGVRGIGPTILGRIGDSCYVQPATIHRPIRWGAVAPDGDSSGRDTYDVPDR